MKSAVWVALDNVSAAAFSFGFFVLAARTLTPATFGAGALTLSVVQILSPMIDSLFHDAVVQKRTLDPEDVATATLASIVWSALLWIALIVASPALAHLMSTPAMADYLPWAGVSLVASGASAVNGALARREMNFTRLAVRTILARTVGTAVGAAMLLRGFGVWALVAQFAISAVLAAVLLLLASPLRLRGATFDRLRPLVAFAAPTMGTQVLLLANGRIITLIIGGVLGPVAAGVWNVALRFLEPLQALFATTIGQLSLPIFSRKQEEPQALAVDFVQGTRRFAMVAAPIFLGLMACAPQVIEVFVGARWLSAAPLMRIAAGVTLLILLRHLAEICLTASGAPRLSFLSHLQSTLLSILGLSLGVAFGPLAAAAGWSARLVPFYTVNLFYLKRMTGLPAVAQLRTIAPSLLAGLLMAALVAAFGRFAFPGLGVLARLGAMVALGAGVYPPLLLAFSPVARRDLGVAQRQVAARLGV